MSALIKCLKYLWPLPWTMVGITIGLIGLASGGRMAIVDGVLEFCGGCLPRWLQLVPHVRGAGAITFGHVVIGSSATTLQSLRAHEHQHVRQYERWGPLFVPAYLLHSLWLKLSGRNYYYSNFLEREAFGTDDPPEPASRSTSGWKSWPPWLLAITLSICLPSLAGHLGAYDWRLDLASHFRVHYALSLCICSVVWWIRGRFHLAILVALALVDNLIAIQGAYWPPNSRPSSQTEIVRIAWFNLLSSNKSYRQVREWVAQESPDYLFFAEVNPQWQVELQKLEHEYKYHYYEARQDQFGIAAFARAPVEFRRVGLGSRDVPAIRVQCHSQQPALVLWGVHVLPPVSAEYSLERDNALRQLAVAIREERKHGQGKPELGKPELVVGDLNATPWCAIFREFQRDTQLRDSRLGFGNQATWPTWAGALEIPIDHCLTSPAIHIVDRRVGGDLGSDHRPLVVDLQIP